MVVLDSSFLIAFHNDRDVHHPRASAAMVRLLKGEWGQALLPEYVFLEVMTVLLARRDIGTATAVGTTLLGAKELEFVTCSDYFLDALDVFRNQGRGTLSFADAAIVAIARARGARHVATFDEEFKKVAALDIVP